MRVRRTLGAAVAGRLIVGATSGAVEAPIVWLQGQAVRAARDRLKAPGYVE